MDIIEQGYFDQHVLDLRLALDAAPPDAAVSVAIRKDRAGHICKHAVVTVAVTSRRTSCRVVESDS